MGKTFAQKILGHKSGHEGVVPGQIVELSPDMTMSHDFAANVIHHFRTMGATRVWDPERIFICLDHRVPPDTAVEANNHQRIRDFCREQDIHAFFDAGTGIAHQVIVEKGYALPGEVVVGTDSHSCSYGVASVFATGIGETEMAFLWATGQLWLRVPETIKIEIEGRWRQQVFAKDVMLALLAQLGIDGCSYRAVEYHGSTIAAMTMSERFTLANMTVEMGGKIGFFPYDGITERYLEGRARRPYTPLAPDPEARYERVVQLNVEHLEPMVALPGSEDRGVPVSQARGISVQQAFLGSCTNARADDLAIAARILKGQQVHPGVRLLVAPASRAEGTEAMRNGDLAILSEAGATILPSGCAICYGGHQGALADGERCISSSNRNSTGRMGNRHAEIYLASPATVAAAAVAGEIIDPGELLADMVDQEA
jgi:3-isopropylmalate/(R)-2-methylmalate dehydratase large subunit